ncbi:MAG: small subunit ribosomal protein S17 [Parcubacteria group bacterium Gr01-1014_18]|nr:MAG: small subunit ribosomal protein S17 [Parcubacteria group bacterium Greene0416_36]TSC80261.1 MAG: small subunit ribosomal protein S17 [Parcubacteria group bacterium Gr01-1014_18]TSC98240.1 MAG: small subunit ribosomal protein S17 [Parcubacteria group bacterium Greene1014_20]TSD07017.1 MAG: small subunit ribosomal protein S17 [Parcubacteria group bacterium Greene0714_2]
MKSSSTKIERVFSGKVVSAKMAKTIVVVVEESKVHPKYHKSYKVSRKYKVHDEKNVSKVGDTVSFMECRPLSRWKRWTLLNKE